MYKFTKGPWSICGADGMDENPDICGANDEYIGSVGSTKADALLICAAPTMYEALAAILWKLERKESKGTNGECTWSKIDRNDAVIEQARQAISKATNG